MIRTKIVELDLKDIILRATNGKLYYLFLYAPFYVQAYPINVSKL